MKDGATRATGGYNALKDSELLVHEDLVMVLPIVLLGERLVARVANCAFVRFCAEMRHIEKSGATFLYVSS